MLPLFTQDAWRRKLLSEIPSACKPVALIEPLLFSSEASQKPSEIAIPVACAPLALMFPELFRFQAFPLLSRIPAEPSPLLLIVAVLIKSAYMLTPPVTRIPLELLPLAVICPSLAKFPNMKVLKVLSPNARELSPEVFRLALLVISRNALMKPGSISTAYPLPVACPVRNNDSSQPIGVSVTGCPVRVTVCASSGWEAEIAKESKVLRKYGRATDRSFSWP